MDVSGVHEMTHAVAAKNVFRGDEPGEEDDGTLLTEQFPEEERGYLKVKGVFERD